MSARSQSNQPASYYMRRAIDSVLATPVIAGVTITSIAVSVLLAGALLLVGSNAFRLIQSWGATGVDVSIYLSRDVSEERVVELKELLAADSAVIDVRYHSQDEAWQFLADNLGDSADLLDGLDASVLPPSLEVSLGRAVDDERLDVMLRTWTDFASTRCSRPLTTSRQSTRPYTIVPLNLDMQRKVLVERFPPRCRLSVTATIKTVVIGFLRS